MPLGSLIAKETFQNMRAYYFDPPVQEAFKRWVAKGGEPWQLIEPVDGFHPNQQANALNTEIMWEMLHNLSPKVIPSVNPYNDLIEKKFGDQGGY